MSASPKLLALLVGWTLSAAPAELLVADDGSAGPPIHREFPDDPYMPRPADLGPPAGSPALPLGFDGVQVNVNNAGNNISGDAANEPSIAVDPTAPNRIVIGWRQFDTVQSNFRQAGWGYSHDGGRTWIFPGVLEPGVFRSDPVLDSDNEGNFHYLSLTTDLGDFWQCDLYSSTVGGVTWQDPVFAWGGDKPWMAVDRTGGVGEGNIYAKWQTFFNCCGQDTFTRSTNGGASFMQPISVPLGPTFGTLNVGPDGALYAAGIWAVDFQDLSRIVIARSSDAQNPAAPPTFDLALDVDLGGSQELGEPPNPAGLLGQVWVASDHSGGATDGNVYLLCSVNPPGSDPLDVMFARSTNGGQTWSNPVRVNDDPGNSNAWQWFGTMSVAPNGRIDVIWNDTRNSGQDNISELFYSFSTDAGQSWSPNVSVSPSFNSHVGWPNQQKLGDYYDMISDRVGAHVAFAATFNNEQDVYYLRIGDYDCNDNGVGDGDDIADRTSGDCNGNGIPDECEIAAGTADDENNNGIPDECDCVADVDGDGMVGITDLLILLAAWGMDPGGPPDLNGDGTVDILDLLLLLAAWGPCR